MPEAVKFQNEQKWLAILRQHGEMLALLKELEWIDDEDGSLCPICDGGHPSGSYSIRTHHGHAPDCRLAAILKEVTDA